MDFRMRHYNGIASTRESGFVMFACRTAEKDA
jgi:hypothetical protein